MNGRNILGLGVLGALGCIAVCAAAAFVPALLAGGGLALITEQLAGWQVAAGIMLLASASLWLFARRRAKSKSCGCNAQVSGKP